MMLMDGNAFERYAEERKREVEECMREDDWWERVKKWIEKKKMAKVEL